MSDDALTTDQLDAVQAVVDRVSAYQESAPESTVETALLEGLEQAQVGLDSHQVRLLAEAIEADDGPADAAVVLGG
ncbi:MAG: hypothetical protein F2667_13780 [Actinobacteria bacterium]|uniref:Unannotated protein n=1 Tax=freshwater metagenome TaxID=449393 RepID=A0A6J6SB29_9ZZZZ|nr:hypothetical protein [Actinomycetota bacterium]